MPPAMTRLGVVALASLAARLACDAVATPSPFARFNFSWAAMPTQAFPGAASRLMTPSEVDGFTRNYSSLMIWGLGATCLNTTDNVTTFPAFCAGSWCQCMPGPQGVDLELQRFVTNMETNLQAQGAALKAAAAAQGVVRPVLGYIDHMSPQQYFAAQNALREDAALGGYRATLASLGGAPIDCMSPTRGGCCEQGSEFAIYNFSDPAVVAYFAQEVVGGLIDGPGLDGTFLDSIDVRRRGAHAPINTLVWYSFTAALTPPPPRPPPIRSLGSGR